MAGGESLEPVRDLRPEVAFVRELSHQQRERLEIAGHSQRTRIDRFEPDVLDQRGCDLLCLSSSPRVITTN
jgi:hypothetical protein